MNDACIVAASTIVFTLKYVGEKLSSTIQIYLYG